MTTKDEMKHTFTIGKQTIELTNDEAITLFGKMCDAFWWRGVIFQQSDIESTLERPLTQDEIDQIVGHYFWEDRIIEVMCEAGWDAIYNMLDDLNIEQGE